MKCQLKISYFIVFCIFHCGTIRAKSMTRLIIDNDAGADDAISILLALVHEMRYPRDLKIMALTCVYGNGCLDNVEQNVLKTLTVANRTDVSVYLGARKPLVYEFYKEKTFFGDDALGDFTFESPIIATIDHSKHAAQAMVDLVKEYPNQITIICLGPLTNVAIATFLDPYFSRNVKEFIVMGASVQGIGNIKPNVEFNFHFDSESNFIVLNSMTRLPIVLFSWETTLKCSTTKEWRKNVLGRIDSNIIDFINKAEGVSLEKQCEWTPADAMAMSIALYPKFITKSTIVNVSPVVEGSARGSVLVDYICATNKTKNVQLVEGLRTDKFKYMLIDYFGGDLAALSREKCANCLRNIIDACKRCAICNMS